MIVTSNLLKVANRNLKKLSSGIAVAIKSRFNFEGGEQAEGKQHKSKEQLVAFDSGLMGLTDLTAQVNRKRRVLINRGREDYYQFVFNNFAKKKKHNLILVGSPGVGKEAIIEGVAERIVKGKAPSEYKDWKVWKLDLDIFITGDYTQGDIPARMNFLHQILANSGKVILYLYPMYVIPEYKIAGDLAEAIKGTNTRVIGTLSSEDYEANKEMFEANEAADSINILEVEEPLIEEVYDQIKFKIKEYAEFHGVNASPKACKKCISEVYRISVGHLDLDAVLDYIDTALAFAKNAGKKELDLQSILTVQKFQLRVLYDLKPEDRRKYAIHEGSHAVVGCSTGIVPKSVAIIPGDGRFGVNVFLEKMATMTKEQIVENIAVFIAPVAYYQMTSGEENNEYGGDLKTATARAKEMILAYAISRENTTLGKYEAFDANYPTNLTQSQELDLHIRVNQILEEAVAKAKEILSREDMKEAQIRIADALCKCTTLTSEEVEGLYKGTLTLDELEDAHLEEIFK